MKDIRKTNVTADFEYQEGQGVAWCTLHTPHGDFLGVAECHDADKDMESEKTGCFIAERRAYIEYYRHYRDNVIIPGLQALQSVHTDIGQSNKCLKSSFEFTKLESALAEKEQELTLIRYLIKYEQGLLNDYIKAKEDFYKKLRAHRQKANNN